jgi:hypothetical protein
MKRIAAYLLVGLGLTNCAESVQDPPPSLVGKWEQMTVQTVFHDHIIELRHEDEWVKNDPGSVWLEFTADGSVNFVYDSVVYDSVASPTNTTYAYWAGSITFRNLSGGETVHPVLELSDHRLVYRSHHKVSLGTEDVTYTYQR